MVKSLLVITGKLALFNKIFWIKNVSLWRTVIMDPHNRKYDYTWECTLILKTLHFTETQMVMGVPGNLAFHTAHIGWENVIIIRKLPIPINP